jgi:death on curing protein
VRFITLAEVIDLHRRVADSAHGPPEIRDLGALESAVAQPRMTYMGEPAIFTHRWEC